MNYKNLKHCIRAGTSTTGFFAAVLTLFALMAANLYAFDANFMFSARQLQPGSDEITVNVIVSAGHMLYRHQMRIESSTGELEVTWPATTEKKDPFGEDIISVYPTGAHSFKLRQKATDKVINDAVVTVHYQGCSDITCYMPTSKSFNFKFNPPLAAEAEDVTGNAQTTPPAATTSATEAVSRNNQPLPASQATTENAPVRVEMSSDIVNFSAAMADQGIAWVLLLAFLGGLLVSLTPCVYPMIPITLSIIGSRDENVSFYKGLGLSATYVAGLSLTYALLGLAAATFGAQIRGFIQGSMFQGLISIIFLLLALSMFDLILIQAPQGLRNKLGGIKKTGLSGIFILGMVSGLMASPCVAAPLAGILAFIAATGSQTIGFFMLLLFAWGMSVPLLLLGAFSGSMNALPRAGEWMNKVKEFYGFLLLAAALYFARPLIGIAWTELGISLLLAAFAAFLGLFKPVTENSEFKQQVFKSLGVVSIAVACAFAISAASQWGCLCLPKSNVEKRADKAETFWFDNLEKAKAEAAKSDKPVFIDFRADWCSVCKDLEMNVFPQPEIRALLKRMVPMKFDATDATEEVNSTLKQFGIVGLPTLVILRPDGTEITELRVIGYISPEQLEKKLRTALK